MNLGATPTHPKLLGVTAVEANDTHESVLSLTGWHHCYLMEVMPLVRQTLHPSTILRQHTGIYISADEGRYAQRNTLHARNIVSTVIV